MVLSVVLPIFNEAENLPTLFEELSKTLHSIGESYEIIAVDDGSTDGSKALLQSLAQTVPHLKVVFLRKNSGQTAAFDAGFRYANGEFIVTMDSDLQNDPKDISRMLGMLKNGYDFVAGWRKNRQDGFILRTFPSKLANALIRKVTRTQFHDLGCSLKMYRADLTRELKLYGEMHRFIGVLMEGMGAKVGEIEVNHRARKAGDSKYGIFRIFKVLLDLLTVWFMRGYRSKPSYVFGGIGFGCLSVSALLSVYVLWEKWGHGIWVHRNPLFLIAVFFGIIAIQFLGMGILAELIIRTYFESSQQVPYFIDRTVGFSERISTSSPTNREVSPH